jgi:hypothetical protein
MVGGERKSEQVMTRQYQSFGHGDLINREVSKSQLVLYPCT